MLRWLATLVLAGILTSFAVLLITGRYAEQGQVVVVLAPGRGLHLGDVFVLTGWLVGLFLCLVLAQRSGSGEVGRRSRGTRDWPSASTADRKVGSARGNAEEQQ